MTAYRDALALSRTDSPERTNLARSLLARGDTVVLLEGQLALRPYGDRVRCEVIDPFAHGVRTAERFERLIESARSLLDEFSLESALPSKQLEWMVVNDDGSVRLWPPKERRSA